MTDQTRASVAVVFLAVMITCGFALVGDGRYGLTVFLLLPGTAGGLAVWVKQPETGGRAFGIGAIAGGLAPMLFLLLGVEGVICAAMAWPLATLLGGIGGWLAYQMTNWRVPTRGLPALLFLPLTTLGWDFNAKPPVFEVHTSMEIAAPPERVWKYVVAFPDLPEPTEWYFHTGVAYPVRTRIEGSGVGAARYCELSTGPVVETIDTWDEPRLLRFRVTSTPPPMRERMLYGNAQPKHLHGYMVSKEGQFRLTALPNGHTLVEGTSWYQHGLWPAVYWRWWSDAIVHRIHLRVLNKIRSLAESGA